MANEVQVDISADTREIVKAINQVEKKLKGFSGNATKQVNAVSNSFSVFAGVLGANIIQSGLSSIVAGLQAAGREAIEFDKAVREINSLLPRTNRLTKETTDALIELSGQFATDQQTQAQTFYQIVSAGITDQAEATKVLTAANTLALGGLADLETTTEALTKVLAVYGDEVKDASEVSDVLFTAVKLGQTRVEDLASSMPQVISLSKSLGVSFQDTTAAVTTLTNRFPSTAEAVTALRALFTSLIKNQEGAKKILGENADLFSIQALQAKGLATFLKDLTAATGDTETLQKVLGGRIESLNAVLALQSDGFQSLTNNMREFTDTIGAASEAAKEAQQSFDFKLDQAGQNITNLATSILNELKPAAEAALDAFNSLFEDPDPDQLIQQITKLEQRMEFLKTIGDTSQIKVIEQQVRALNAELAKVRPLAGGEGAPAGLLSPTGAQVPLAPEQQQGFTGVVSSEAQKEAEAVLQIDKERREEIAKRDAEDREKNKELREANIELAAQRRDEELAMKQLQADEDLQLAASRLGRENAIEELAEINKLKRQKKFLQADKKQKDFFEKADKARAFRIVKSTELTEKQKVQIIQSSLQQIATLQSQSNKTLFAIGKAAALANAIVNTALGVTKALSLGPIIGPPLAALIAVAGAAQIAVIAAQKPPPAFQDGGFVTSGPASGDRVTARVNRGEAILNTRQQREFMDIANGRGGGAITINVEGNIIASDEEEVNSLIDRIGDQLEFRNATLRGI